MAYYLSENSLSVGFCCHYLRSNWDAHRSAASQSCCSTHYLSKLSPSRYLTKRSGADTLLVYINSMLAQYWGTGLWKYRRTLICLKGMMLFVVSLKGSQSPEKRFPPISIRHRIKIPGFSRMVLAWRKAQSSTKTKDKLQCWNTTSIPYFK